MWITRLGDIMQNVQTYQAGADSAACGKSLLLTYALMPSPRTLFMPFYLTYEGSYKVGFQQVKPILSLVN